MTGGSFSFLGHSLDPHDRQLRRDDVPVELNARYFDALALLVREAGQLVSKDRFLDEVWRGVPVTDEALTQCIKTLRRQLGDQATAPRFIETVPKHGYRFIAPVTTLEQAPAIEAPQARLRLANNFDWRRFGLLGTAGTLGGGAAGLLGGLLYGFATAARPLGPGGGEASALLVLMFLTILAGLVGGAGVSFGLAAAETARQRKWMWTILGGAVGGLTVGAFARLLGLDAFNLLFGHSPADMTGGAEGALLGAAVGLGAWIAFRRPSSAPIERNIALAALTGMFAGLLVPLAGGRMMGGSLDQLARQFPASRLRIDHIGTLFGERDFGLVSQAVTGAIEGGLFAAGIVAAMALARRGLDARR